MVEASLSTANGEICWKRTFEEVHLAENVSVIKHFLFLCSAGGFFFFWTPLYLTVLSTKTRRDYVAVRSERRRLGISRRGEVECRSWFRAHARVKRRRRGKVLGALAV